LSGGLATGQFSYAIPVMTVPGKRGMDFPIVLSYAGGVKQGQKSGFVGLGWSLNVPSIQRQVLGIPDDYQVGADNNFWVEDKISGYTGYQGSWVEDANKDSFENFAEVKHNERINARFITVDGKDLVFMLLNDKDVHPSYDLGVWVKTPYFASAMDLAPIEHVKVQAAVQKWTDSSISKTANAPADFTVAQTAELYEQAYELGCKGVTIYRDNSRTEQVLTTDASKENQNLELLHNVLVMRQEKFEHADLIQAPTLEDLI